MRRAGNDHGHGGFVLAHVDLDHQGRGRKENGEVDVVTRLAHVGTSSIQIDHQIMLLDGTVAPEGDRCRFDWVRQRGRNNQCRTPSAPRWPDHIAVMNKTRDRQH